MERQVYGMIGLLSSVLAWKLWGGGGGGGGVGGGVPIL